MKIMKKLQQGIGLLELMLSLAIISVLLLMATRYYESAHRAQGANQGVEFVNSLKAAAANYSAAHSDYTDLDATTFCKLGLVARCDTTNNTLDPWNGKITLDSSSKQNFVVTMPNVPATVCANIKDKFSDASYNATCAGTTGITSFNITLGDVN